MLFCVQREGSAHLRDRLTLRLLRSQHTAATADYLMVFTATIRDRSAYGTQIFLSHGRRGERSRIHQHGLDGSIRSHQKRIRKAGTQEFCSTVSSVLEFLVDGCLRRLWLNNPDPISQLKRSVLRKGAWLPRRLRSQPLVTS